MRKPLHTLSRKPSSSIPWLRDSGHTDAAEEDLEMWLLLKALA